MRQVPNQRESGSLDFARGRRLRNVVDRFSPGTVVACQRYIFARGSTAFSLEKHRMTQPRDDGSEITRVTQEIADRLRTRGIEVLDSDSPEDVVQLLEALEGFERAVESAGGDLMMDEPPSNQRGEPDDPHFLLPKRKDGEPTADYLTRLTAATVAARKHKPHS
jgi:hypothetical protein